MRRFKVAEEAIGTRADVYLTQKYPEFTRSSLEGLFNDNLVLINKIPIKAGYKLKAGQTLNVNDSSLHTNIKPVELPILYEDNDVVVIDKPAGLLTHSKGALNLEATVASFIASKITDAKLTGNRAGIVHRLDRGTSGVIITARTAEALVKLQKQFSTRKTKKTYWAIVEGVPAEPEAIIDAPIERNPKKPQSFRAGANGKSAITQYKVLKTAIKSDKRYTLLELKPLTGRTHQIRIHLSYIGHPVVGDWTYGTDGDHLYLHAKDLELTLPSGQRKVFSTPPPNYFNNFIKL